MSKVTMNVPKGTQPFTLTYGGNIDQPQTYKPTDGGTVQVEQEHLAEFLRFLPGATPASNSAEQAVSDVQTVELQTPAAAGAQRRSAPPR